MHSIQKRITLHFPGFEPLDADAHRRRYGRSSVQSGVVWSCSFETGELQGDDGAAHFEVVAEGPGWQTRTDMHVFDHSTLVASLRAKPLYRQLFDGYRSAGQVIAEGGMTGYFRHAWRFALFFLFPFLLTAIALAISVAIALAPWMAGAADWHFGWSLPLGFAFFVWLFLPFSERFHTLHLFADWQMAVAVARLDNPVVSAWLDTAVTAARAALAQPADEYLVTSHSMGANMATHVIGELLRQDPALLAGKRVVFVTLGGAVLQSSLLHSAKILREKVGRIARCCDLTWIDVQCLTDSIHFYKSRVVAATGHADAPAAKILFIRFKHMLTAAHYTKIKRNFLRVHRQYVLGSDRRAAFDFTLMTAGPLPAAGFAAYSAEQLPPIAADGALIDAEPGR